MAHVHHCKMLSGQCLAQRSFQCRALAYRALQQPFVGPEPQQLAVRAQAGGIGCQGQGQTRYRLHRAAKRGICRVTAQIEHVHQGRFAQRDGLTVDHQRCIARA